MLLTEKQCETIEAVVGKECAEMVAAKHRHITEGYLQTRPPVKNEPAVKNGEPCGHPGCLSHISHPCEGCGRVGGHARAMPPETIYLQCYDEYDGNLLDIVHDDVTWCRDRINDNDAVYILATPELARLLGEVIRLIQMNLVQMSVITTEDLQDILVGNLLRKTIDRARALQVRIEGSLG